MEPTTTILSTSIVLKIDGAAVDSSVMNQVIAVEVDQTVGMPSMFTVRLLDNRLEMLDKGPFDLTKEVEISADNGQDRPVVLIKGEVTALEPSFGRGMQGQLVVRGYDKSHRLYRETRSATYLNSKDSDIASEIAGNVGLSAEVDSTSTIYDHIYQNNQNDLEFLRQRAWRIGYECFVAEGKLFFRKPPKGSAETTLAWGHELVSFDPRMTLAEQVDEVIVKGWDSKKLAPIIGEASKAVYPKLSESKDGAKWAADLGVGKRIVVDLPVVDQGEAKAIAQARLDELGGTFVAATGVAFRSPAIMAGKFVKLENLGQRLSGTYMVTAACHRYDRQGLYTEFSVSGKRTNSVTAQMMGHNPIKRWQGVVTAIVTNTQDELTQGHIKVKYPWMDDALESGWARWSAPGAGAEAGLFAIPAVGEEVLVAFEQGDFNRPIIIGSLWNGQHKLPPDAAGLTAGEESMVRVWQTHGGHKLVLRDDKENKAELITSGGHTFQLEDKGKKVLLASSGGHMLEFDDGGKKVTLKNSGGAMVELDANSGKVTIKTKGDIAVQGMNIELKANVGLKLNAGANVEIKGAMIDINGQATVNVKAPMVNLG